MYKLLTLYCDASECEVFQTFFAISFQTQLRMLQQQHEDHMKDMCSTLEQEHEASLERVREELISQYDDELEEMQKELTAHSGSNSS